MWGLAPEFVALVLSWVILGVVVVGFSLRAKHVAAEAYADGVWHGLEVAAGCVRERAEIARELAPEGKLQYAMVRAQMADQIEYDLTRLQKELTSIKKELS